MFTGIIQAVGSVAAVEVQGLFSASLEDLRSTSVGVLPGLFG